MSISRRNNRALNRVLRDSLRTRPQPEPPPEESAKADTPAYTLSTDIPDSYNDSYVKAIPKDPQNTFVYWELPKGQAEGSLFADRGTAHVGHDEAVRIGQQLNENQRRRQADEHRNEEGGYHQINWDNGNHYNFDDGNQQHHRGVDNYRQDDTGNRQTNWDDGSRQHHHGVDNYRQINWDDGNQYRQDDGRRHQHHHYADNRYIWNDGNQYRLEDIYQQLNNLNQYNWSDGDRYRIDEIRQHFHNNADGIYQLNWNDGGDYAARHNDGAAFSEMLEALIARCNRYIADYRQSGSSPPAYAISSGLLIRDIDEEIRS